MGNGKPIHYLNILFCLMFLLFNTCEQSHVSGVKLPNSPPETYLANIPPANSPENPYFFQLSFTWDGGDEDGIVVGFYYRIDGQDWTFTESRNKLLSFPSPDSVNLHTFEVKAVDNEGTADPTPASRSFYTAQNQNPDTEITFGPLEGSKLFVLPEITETWRGIEIRFKGSDGDGSIIGFEYTLDDTTTWLFTENDFIRLVQISEGNHNFFVRAVDDAQGKDAQPAQLSFIAIVATFDMGILVIDETRDGTGTSNASPSDEQVDQFYDEIITASGRTYTQWDLATQGLPTAVDLAPYSLIIWQADDRAKQEIRSSIELIKDYLGVGGKLWIVGWRVIAEIDIFVGASSHEYREGEFGYDYMSLQTYNEQSQLDFIGAKGVSGYPDIDLDPDKLLSSYDGKLNFIGTMIPNDMNEAEAILTFNSSTNSTFHDQPCAIKTVGSNYNIIAFSFPLYFMNKTQAISVVGNVLADFDE